MKWVTLICLLFCTIVTESKYLRKRDVDHHSRLIAAVFPIVGKVNFEHLMLVMLAQNFQKCKLEEFKKVIEEISTFAQHCVDHEDEECKKPMTTIFHDRICKHPELVEKYPWSVECCAKAEPEREKCFHDHREIIEEPYQIRNAEAICKEHAEHPEHAFNSYIVTISNRNPSIYPSTILEIAARYNNIITECCAEEEKEKCFKIKFFEASKNTFNIELEQKHVCHVLSAFPDEVHQSIKIAKISQKHPATSFEIVEKFSIESIHMSRDCCTGDTVECMIEKMEYTQHICDDQEKISPSLKACCEKPVLGRTPCIMALPKDEVPADLPDMSTFIEDEHVCKAFADDKDAHLKKFLHEFSKRYPELSLQGLLRSADGYKGLVTKSCATDNPIEYRKAWPQMLEAAIKATKDPVKETCDAYEKHGPFIYNLFLLGHYVPIMPQMSDADHLETSDKMTKLFGKCCALSEIQRLPCVEEKMDLLLGQLCERQTHTFINDQVRHCCVDSYANRRQCFLKLGADPSYQPPQVDESALQVGADLCKGSEQEQKNKRLSWPLHAWKLKPKISQQKMYDTFQKITEITEKCCAAADRQLCFESEKPTLRLHFEESLGH